jgi:hypothetical protein
MGKPMKSRILSAVLALSLIAVLFAALPTSAAINYTGTLTTTDSSGVAKTSYIQGEPVYAHIRVMFQGAPADTTTVLLSLVRSSDGVHVDDNFVTTNANGYYNTTAGTALATGSGFTGDIQSYDVVVTAGGDEVARSAIFVRHTGITLTPTPNNPAYWPGENVTITLVVDLAHTADLFYVEVVNWSGGPTGVNFTDQSAATGYWSKSFTVGAAWPDGTGPFPVDHRYAVHVRDKLTHALWGYNARFSVQAYEFTVQSERSGYLPGETAKITYLVQDLSTLATITSGVTVTYSAVYMNKTGNLTWLNGTLDVAQTLWEFTLPTNGTAKTSIALYSDIDITMWAKQAAGNRNVSRVLSFTIGAIDGDVGLNANNFHPGDTVEVTVSVDVNGDALDGAKVDVTVAKNGTDTIAAYAATNLTTDSSGSATYVFKLVASSDLMTVNYIVKATITKAGYSAVRENVFIVTPNSALRVALDQSYYYGGQEATASFATFVNNLPVTVDDIGYVFWLGPNILLSGSTKGNTATVAIPENGVGTLTVVASAHINGQIVENAASVQVIFAELGLTAEKGTYRPGETIVFQWSIVTGQTSASLAYEILDSSGIRVANGTPEFAKIGSFELVVPEANPLLPTHYHATLRMTTPEGGFASDSTTVDIISNIELTVTIGKSSYTSGEYAPGQKVSIKYELSSYLFASRPTIRLHVSVGTLLSLMGPGATEFDVIVSSPTGKVSYTIPKDAPNLEHYVMVEAYDAATGEPLADATSGFMVNNQASGWDASVGGISAIDLILLILVIIVIIMLIVVPYMKDRMARPKPPESKPMELTPPPSEPGKTPPAP